jgi:hypothetical protein
LQPCEVRRSMDFPFCLTLRTVEAKNDEFHRAFSSFWFDMMGVVTE